MEDATTIERESAAELHEAQNSANQSPDDNLRTKSEPGPNIIVYGIIGTIGAIGDALGFIPVVGAILRAPFQAIIYLWKLMSGKLGESPGQKILTNALLGITPLPSNTTFIVTSYLEETKLGKKTIGKLSKAKPTIK
jgi:hypothetical protein